MCSRRLFPVLVLMFLSMESVVSIPQALPVPHNTHDLRRLAQVWATVVEGVLYDGVAAEAAPGGRDIVHASQFDWNEWDAMWGSRESSIGPEDRRSLTQVFSTGLFFVIVASIMHARGISPHQSLALGVCGSVISLLIEAYQAAISKGDIDKDRFHISLVMGRSPGTFFGIATGIAMIVSPFIELTRPSSGVFRYLRVVNAFVAAIALSLVMLTPEDIHQTEILDLRNLSLHHGAALVMLASLVLIVVLAFVSLQSSILMKAVVLVLYLGVALSFPLLVHHGVVEYESREYTKWLGAWQLCVIVSTMVLWMISTLFSAHAAAKGAPETASTTTEEETVSAKSQSHKSLAPKGKHTRSRVSPKSE